MEFSLFSTLQQTLCSEKNIFITNYLTIFAASSKSSHARILRPLAVIKALASSTRVPSETDRMPLLLTDYYYYYYPPVSYFWKSAPKVSE